MGKNGSEVIRRQLFLQSIKYCSTFQNMTQSIVISCQYEAEYVYTRLKFGPNNIDTTEQLEIAIELLKSYISSP